MLDGDVYDWRWADDAKHADCGPYRSYHCCSRIAVVEDGLLHDTFWSSPGARRLDPETVVLILLGNLNDMTEVRESEARYYRSDDIVDMRHSNNYRATVYLKNGAPRNAQTMQTHVQIEIENAQSEIRFAKRKIERMIECSDQIISGKLDDVHF